MKLHLPISLFRAIMAVILSTPVFVNTLASEAVTFSTQTTIAGNNATAEIENSIPYYTNGKLTLYTQQENPSYSSYEKISFENIQPNAIVGGRSSTISLSANGEVSFIGNGTADYVAGGIYGAMGGSIELSENESISFIENVGGSAGAIWKGSNNTLVSICDNGNVLFSKNKAMNLSSTGGILNGGAIDAGCTLNIRNNDNVLFEKNLSNLQSFYYLHAISASDSTMYGGSEFSAGEGKVIEFREAVRVGGSNSVVWNRDYTVNGETVKQTGDIVFTGAFVEENLNEMLQNVGAGRSASTKELLWSRCSLFIGESVLHGGRLRIEDGAIYRGQGMTVAEGSDATVRLQNAALCHGGYTLTFNPGTTLELHGNNAISGTVDMHSGSKIVIDEGITDINGALYFLGNATFNLNGDKDSSSNNQVLLCVANEVYGWSNVQQNIANGGALTWVDDLLILNYDANSYNRHFRGSAVYNSTQSNDLMLHHYNSVEFNDIRNSNSGGALTDSLYITRNDRDNTSLRYNDSVIFRRNSSSSSDTYAQGGAIYGGSSNSTGTTIISDNGSVIFDANTASSSASWANGGAIVAKNLTLNNNGSVIFKGNVVSSDTSSPAGGAIAIVSRGDLNIRNNDSVLFEKNVEKSGSTYCLRSIHTFGNSPSVISLSSAAGKSIEFRDSVYIGSGTTVNLNADYTDANGVVHKQQGDIIFTGKYAETHLNEILAADEQGRTATAKEILNSRTTSVAAMTNLYGGRLRVEDGAIYKGYGITAHEGSAATVRMKDASQEHVGYNITMNAGTALELEGSNSITAVNLIMQEGSNLHFALGETNRESAALTLDGSLLLNGAVNLSFDLNFDVTIGVYKLVSLSGSELLDWSQLTVAEGSGSGYNFTLNSDKTGLSLEIFWTQMELPQTEGALTLSDVTCGQMNLADTYSYDSISVTRGCYSLVGSGSVGVSGLLSVTGGADLTLDVDTTAMVVEVGDDSSLSLQKGLNLVSLMTLDDEETESAKAISVGRNAELSLTDAALLGQVATADETSAVYYQTEAGDKLLKFTGDLGNGGLNLTLGEDGKTVSATDSAGFTGNITVLSGTTLVNEATSTTDGLPFGDNYATAADKTITVQGGATLDINGRETYYHLVLEKDALLTNSGTDTHHDWKGVPVIDLSGDAEVNAAAQICMVGANYASTTLNLNGNTLTKTGSANLVLRNTSINEGTLAVNGGLVRFMGNTSTAAGTGIQVNNGGTLWISEGTGNYAGSLVLNTGGHVYLGEGPSGTLGGDNGTNSQAISLTGLGKLELAGGTMTFRGENLSMGTVDVTAASTLELWDQTGSDGVATTASTISTLNMSANLNLATTWKSSLDIASLTGSGELLVGSSREKHRVSVQDLSGFSGTFAIRGANSTLSLNLGGDDEMNATRVTKDDSAVLILEGSGTYCFSNLENVTAAATGISDIQFGDTWSGKIALRNSTSTGMELDDFGGAGKTIVIEGVSGWFSYNRTVESHLQLVESGLTLLDTSKKTYTYTGGISGSGDFIIKSKADNTYTGTYDLSGDLSAWDGAFRVQQSEDNTNTAPVNLNLTGGGTLFSGTDGCGVLMERTGEMNVTIGNAGTATTMRGDIRNVGVTNEGTTTYGTVNVTLNNTVDAQGDIIASRINVGAGADINFSGTVQANQWTVGDDARLVIESGSKVYLSEADNGTLRGDVGTDDVGTLDLTRTAGVELAGGTLFYRGKNITLGSVDVTEDSVLEIWDQTGVDGVASHACTIDTLNLNASLEQKTTWKCTLEIGSLTGSGPLTVSSRNEKHYVTLNDLSAYTGTVSISGANTTLTLNIVKEAVVDASLVTKDNASHLVLKGQGSYNIGTARSLAAGVRFAEDWEGSVRLTGAMAGETLSGLNQESSWVELFGVSGYLSQADAATGAQTYGMNLKLTDAGETAAWNLNNGWNGDVRTFTGMVCGTGTLNRNHYKGTEQTLIFAGDVSGWSGALEHNATSATNNGQKVKTNVTFNGSSEINVAMRTNGKGELNVTLDDANLAAGSKVTVNNAVSATNFTVTEGTAAKLNNTLQVSGVVELMAAASLELGEVVSLSAGAGSAQLNTVSLNSTEIRGTGDASSLTNLQMQNLSGSFAVADVALHEVEISGSNSALTLSNVSLDDSCTIDLGTAGTVTFDNSTLCLTVPELSWDGSEVLHIDCSALLTGNALGNLLIDLNHSVDEIVNLGYQTVAVDFGANVNTTNLNLNLSQAQFTGFMGSIAQFNLVPEPATATLGLSALLLLCARRRRK